MASWKSRKMFASVLWMVPSEVLVVKALCGSVKVKFTKWTATNLFNGNSINSCYARSVTISYLMLLATNVRIVDILATRSVTRKSWQNVSQNPTLAYVFLSSGYCQRWAKYRKGTKRKLTTEFLIVSNLWPTLVRIGAAIVVICYLLDVKMLANAPNAISPAMLIVLTLCRTSVECQWKLQTNSFVIGATLIEHEATKLKSSQLSDSTLTITLLRNRWILLCPA